MANYYDDPEDVRRGFYGYDDDEYDIVRDSTPRVSSIIDTNVFLGAGDDVFSKLEDQDIIIDRKSVV